MISRSCQDSSLNTSAFRSSKGPRMSTETRITIAGKHDGKKCDFECWYPDNCSPTAANLRSVAGVNPGLSDMVSKRNRIHSSRSLIGSIKGDVVGKWNANGAGIDNLRSHAQSIQRVMKSAGCGCPPISTRFSVQPRSHNSRPLNTISCRISSSPFSSHSSHGTDNYLTMANNRYETTKPAARFSLFRANNRRGTGRTGSEVDVCCSTLPMDRSRETASCSQLHINLQDNDSSSVDSLPAGCVNPFNASIQEAIAHIVTGSLQRDNDFGGEDICMPEDLHGMKTEQTHQAHSDAEQCWNKLWNNIPPSYVEENQSMVKLRQMAGKLIESLICKIKLQLDSETQPEVHDRGKSDREEHKHEVNEHQQHSHRTKELAAGAAAARSKRPMNDYEQHRDDANQSKEAIGKRAAKEKSLKAADQIDDSEQLQQSLHSLAEIQTTIAKSGSKLLSPKPSDDQIRRQYTQESGNKSAQHSINGSDRSSQTTDLKGSDVSVHSDQKKGPRNVSNEKLGNKGKGSDERRTERQITSAKDGEIRGVSSNGSNQRGVVTNAATEEGGEDDEEEDEDEETESGSFLQDGSHQSINEEARSKVREEKQQPGKIDQQTLQNNDYVEKTEAVMYRSIPPQPSSSSVASTSMVASELSASSMAKEHAPKLEAGISRQKVKAPGGNDAAGINSQKVKAPGGNDAAGINSQKVKAPSRNDAAGINSQKVKAPGGNDAAGINVTKKDAEATSSQSIVSNREDLDETIEQATMDPEAEATLKSFATEVVQSLYTAIRYKLKNLVQDGKDEAKKLEIIQKGDIELKDQILPTIIEHIVWIIKEEFRGQDESEWKYAMMHDPGQYLDTIVTNAVMKTHADHMAQRSFLKTFVVTSNFKHSAKWKL